MQDRGLDPLKESPTKEQVVRPAILLICTTHRFPGTWVLHGRTRPVTSTNFNPDGTWGNPGRVEGGVDGGRCGEGPDRDTSGLTVPDPHLSLGPTGSERRLDLQTKREEDELRAKRVVTHRPVSGRPSQRPLYPAGNAPSRDQPRVGGERLRSLVGPPVRGAQQGQTPAETPDGTGPSPHTGWVWGPTGGQ